MDGVSARPRRDARARSGMTDRREPFSGPDPIVACPWETFIVELAAVMRREEQATPTTRASRVVTDSSGNLRPSSDVPRRRAGDGWGVELLPAVPVPASVHTGAMLADM